MLRAALAFLVFVSISVTAARAIELKLSDGTKVSGARVDRIDNGIAVVVYDGGVTTMPEADLPPALRASQTPAKAAKPVAPVAPAPNTVPAGVKSVPIKAAPRAVTTMPTVRPTPPPRAVARPDYVIDPLRGVVAIPPPTPPPVPAAAPAAPNDPRRVVVTAEAVPYIERFAEDENSDVMKRYQENLLTKKKIRDEKDAPKDILNLPIYRWSPFRDPNQSAFTSPILKNDDQFFTPNSMRPGSYVDDPYNGKK
ncbi:hypothetical protein AYO41_02700 [Verrucomicrobia bacterium SCGC AG-212-E04]|nr:hypothetical protein AYO41_02700 [Verrucomicrobia bacterium SCGC AG-212-E04]